MFIKDFGLFLHDGNEAKLIAGRGPEGKKGKQGPAGKDGVDGQDGADGKDGSQIEAMEIKGTSLVLVVKDADGEVKSFDTDLAPFLDAAVEVTKSLNDDHTKAQADEIEARVKSLWNHLNEHLTDQQAVPVRFYRGLWLPSTAYQVGDMVTYASGQYLCRQPNTGVMPFGQLASDINSGDYWVQFSSGSGGGTGEAGEIPTRITTDMVQTNPSVTFRDSKGRFKTKVDVTGLTDQLKVNRFIADELDALVASDSDLQEQIDELKAEPAPEPEREPIFAEQAPTEYPAQPPEPLEPGDQWYEVTDPDFDYDNPDPEGLDLYIWTATEDDPSVFEWVLYVPPPIVEYVKKEGGDEMEGPLKIKNNPEIDNSRDARKLEVLDIKSGTENSSLNLGAKNTSVYIGAEKTTFANPIHVDDIKEKDDGAGITIHDTLKFGSEQDVLMEIDPKTGEEQKIKLFDGPGDNDKTLNVSLHGATYQNAIEFESGPSAQREPILRIDSNKGLKAKNVSAWDTRVRDVAAPEDEQDATNKTYVDEIGTRLQAEIDQLALGLEALIVQREAGKWTYKGALADGIPSSAGEFSLGSDDLTASTNVIILNQTDLTGKFHGFGDVDVGDYVEIVDLDKPDEYALFVVDSEADGDGIVQFNLKLKDKGNNFLVGTTCEIRFFALTEQDLNLTELDTRYAQKSHNHDARDITSGTISMSRLPTGTSSTSVAVGNHSHSGVYAPADHTHSGLGGSVLVKHGYPCRIDYDHQHSGSDKHMIKYRSWGNGYAYEAQGSSKICETGEVKIVYNSSGWENKIGKRGLLVASTSNSNPWVYPYLVMNIFDANQYIQYGMVNYEFKGTVSWCRSTGATWSSDPEFYWTWIGDGK